VKDRPSRRAQSPRYDVLGLGCTAVDELLYVEAYPPADAKLRVRRRERACGGLTATALVAAARLGARCAYAGVLGVEDDSQFVLETLRREGIDVRHAVRRRGAHPIRSVIVVDERRHTRNVFYDTTGFVGAAPDAPSERLICSARVLFVDLWGMDGMVRAARLARTHGIPVVGDLERSDAPRFRELLRLVDHLIVPAAFACRFTETRTPAAAAERLWRKERQAVVVTCGADGCWSVDGASRRAVRWPAFRVRAVDTTGCGDVFHGAYAAALAKGLSLPERIQWAAAAAALKATQAGGQAGIPTHDAVAAFLRRNRLSPSRPTSAAT
jgi:sugar/nucleoside kinase (ribokinase family)